MQGFQAAGGPLTVIFPRCAPSSLGTRYTVVQAADVPDGFGLLEGMLAILLLWLPLCGALADQMHVATATTCLRLLPLPNLAG